MTNKFVIEYIMKRIIILSLIVFLTAGCQCNRQVESNSDSSSVTGSELGNKYGIVVGAFHEKKLAERRVQDLAEKGYPASIVNYKDGIWAVVICQSDNLDDTEKKLDTLRGTDVCPVDGWILKKE